jgi:hypothetical protein
MSLLQTGSSGSPEPTGTGGLVLFVSAKRKRVQIQSQTNLSYLRGFRTEFAGAGSWKPVPLFVPLQRNDVWSMDFMHDQLTDGRSVRLFNVIETSTAKGLA